MRVTGQAETGSLVSSVELVEEQVKALKTFVGVLSRVIDPMIVIPQGAQRLVDVTVWLMVGGESRLLTSEVVIEILSAEKPTAGTAVAFGGGVEIVQVGGHLRDAEAAVLVLRRQFIEAANQPRLLIVTDDCRSGECSDVARRRPTQIVSPDRLRGNIYV